MSSDWDMPETYRPTARVNPAAEPARAPAAARGSGVIDPIALFRFVLDNFVKIGAIAIALTAIAVVLVSLIPFPYRATATVLVDPRNQQVTLQEDVLQPIGSDARAERAIELGICHLPRYCRVSDGLGPPRPSDA